MSAPTLTKWLNTPPAQWSQRFHAKTSEEIGLVAREADRMAQRAAMLNGYLLARNDGQTHAQAVKAANRRLVRVRRAMGYAMPKAGTFDF